VVTSGLQIETNFTTKSLGEAARQGRRWYAWPLWFVQNAYGILLVAGLLWAVVAGLIAAIHGKEHNVYRLLGLAGFLIVLVGVYLWSYWNTLKQRSLLLSKINPVRLTLSQEGITWVEPSGASSFVPWTMYSDFRDGRFVCALRTTAGGPYRSIPKDTLTEPTSERIRSVLLANLPESR